jgi:hypothetical protein
VGIREREKFRNDNCVLDAILTGSGPFLFAHWFGPVLNTQVVVYARIRLPLAFALLPSAAMWSRFDWNSNNFLTFYLFIFVIKHVIDVGSTPDHNSNTNTEVTQENNCETILYCFLDIDDYNRGSPTYIYPEYVLEFGKCPHNKRTRIMIPSSPLSIFRSSYVLQQYLHRSSWSFSRICLLFVASLLCPLFEQYNMLLLIRLVGLTFHFGFSQFFVFCKTEGLAPRHPNAWLAQTLLPH